MDGVCMWTLTGVTTFISNRSWSFGRELEGNLGSHIFLSLTTRVCYGHYHISALLILFLCLVRLSLFCFVLPVPLIVSFLVIFVLGRHFYIRLCLLNMPLYLLIFITVLCLLIFWLISYVIYWQYGFTIVPCKIWK